MWRVGADQLDRGGRAWWRSDGLRAQRECGPYNAPEHADLVMSYVPNVPPSMPALGPVFKDVDSAVAVLATTLFVPTPVDDLVHAICTMSTCPSMDDEAALSQMGESLVHEALNLVANCVAFESCVAEVKHFY